MQHLHQTQPKHQPHHARASSQGVVPIIVSWFFSPVFTAIASALLFFIIRTAVLRRKNAYQMSFWLLPIFVMLTVW
jgi:solute carrier family 20 (sodium-dependent phosphate transporter)